jgi:hypothetical protein
MSTSTAAKPLMNFAVSQAIAGDGPSVLVLADSDVVATTALATSLSDSGVQVTVRPGPEYTWDGTNPSLTGFDVVIHLNGSSYEAALPSSAQTALTSFVQNGGGLVAAKWNGYEWQPDMAELVLQDMGGDPAGPEQNCAACQITYQTISAAAGHPVLAGLPSSFTFTADAHDAGPPVVFASNPSIALMEISSGRPGVLAREFGSGRVVQFSFAPNYYWDDSFNPRDPTTLLDLNVQKLYLNAVRWASGSATGTTEPQSITFDPLADRVYGDPAFDLSATASSGLPVNYTASGTCEVLGVTVTITAAGSCSVTAHQAGNDSYEPAADVSRSFNIAKANPVISWVPASITAGTPLGNAQLNATFRGLGGVTLIGNALYTPGAGTTLPAGPATLSVQFTPSDANYAVGSRSVSITVLNGVRFSGFFAPVKNMPVVNVVSAGSAVPMKFSIGGHMGLQILSGTPTSVPVQCGSDPQSTITTVAPLTRDGLSASGYTYTYLWKTNVLWAGSCRKFILTLADGSTHEAMFRFPARLNPGTTARRILRGR